jgi:hypothetical protein
LRRWAGDEEGPVLLIAREGVTKVDVCRDAAADEGRGLLDCGGIAAAYAGVVGPPAGSKAREVLVGPDAMEAVLVLRRAAPASP